MISDNELLRHYVAEGSETAFAELVQRHLSLVYSAALRRTDGDAPLAEDVAQFVFTALARDAAKLQRHTILAGWLYVATRHAAANAMRAERRRRLREQEAHAMHEPSASAPDWNQLRPELDRVMDALNTADRDAVLLRYFENRPFAEIGASLRISEDAARMRVERALDKLRTLLAQRGISSTAAVLAALLANQAAVAAPAGLAATVTSGAISGSAAVGATTAGLGLLSQAGTVKAALTAAGVLALLSVGPAVYHYRSAREARGALAALQKTHTTMQGQLQRQTARMWEAEENARLAESRAAAAEAPFSSAKPAERSERGQPQAVGSTLDILMADPAYQELTVRQYATTLRFRYAALYRKLGWGAGLTAEFERLKVKEWEALNEMMAAARTQGVSVVEPTLIKLLKPTNVAIADELRRLMGEADYVQYAAHDAAFAARTSVEALAGSLLYSDAPLSLAQAEQLTQIIAAATPPTKSTGLVGVTRSTDWETVFSQSHGVLLPAQLATLRALAEKTRATQQLTERAQLLLRAAASKPAAPPAK
jgi:RNA polymerase sigma factor (sigma-70 family)